MIIVAFVIITLLVIVDQLIKIWCLNNLVLHESIDWIKIGGTKLFDLTLHENTGALFGSMAGKTALLIVVSSITAIIAIFLLIKFYKRSKLFFASMILVVSGGIGNLIDRIFRDGKVVDMFDFQLFDFAIFNFADICVTIGAILLCVYVIFIDGRIEKREKLAKTVEADTNE